MRNHFRLRALLSSVLIALVLLLAGCAAQPPSPQPTATPCGNGRLAQAIVAGSEFNDLLRRYYVIRYEPMPTQYGFYFVEYCDMEAE